MNKQGHHDFVLKPDKFDKKLRKKRDQSHYYGQKVRKYSLYNFLQVTRALEKFQEGIHTYRAIEQETTVPKSTLYRWVS